ncbi:homoserine kinase [Asanoa sp. NPDC050611]|uniref:homoserine kinase n=1 Tax=Asanoa sp. NPDC050611 TaxID=3157098 RepID=UPI0033C4EC4A
MGVSFVDGAVRVRVPATSANLGPGFDALGLALGLHDDVAAWVIDRGWHVDVAGEGAGELPTGADHLVARAMAATFERLGRQPPGVAIECVNRIPQARGLGSSSAAIVAGVQLARALVRDGTTLLDDDAALALAAELEGHPDNVAPCLLGGFVIAWSDADGFRAVRLAPDERIRPTVFVPSDRGLTAEARAALPATVPHHDAAFTAGRAALLVHALTEAPDLLFPATADRLHQSYRAPGMPATAALVDELRGRGVAAVVSGAGPTVLALTSPPKDLELGIDWRVVELAIDVAGARIGSGRLGHAERAPVAAGRKS